MRRSPLPFPPGTPEAFVPGDLLERPMSSAERHALTLLGAAGPGARRIARRYVHESQQAMASALRAWLASPEARGHRDRRLVQKCLRAIETTLETEGAEPVTAAVDPLLSTSDVAAMLGCSRPHVVMLIDAGALPAQRTAGNHRRVKRSAVLAYQDRSRQPPGVGYRQAAAEGGLYDIDDSAYAMARLEAAPEPLEVRERGTKYVAKKKK